MDRELENIINKLVKLVVFVTRDHAGCVADFILADRKRIVTPLVKAENKVLRLRPQHWQEHKYRREAIIETLHLAGLHEGQEK